MDHPVAVPELREHPVLAGGSRPACIPRPRAWRFPAPTDAPNRWSPRLAAARWGSPPPTIRDRSTGSSALSSGRGVRGRASLRPPTARGPTRPRRRSACSIPPARAMGTIVQPVPFHRSIRVRLSPVVWSTQEPTANRRDEPGTPVIAAREQCRPATSGAGTMLQPAASRCIVRVPFEVLSPTAQTSVAENARTSERWFSSAAPPSFGLGTTVQAWPFQCSIKVFGTSAGSSAEPTAHAFERASHAHGAELVVLVTDVRARDPGPGGAVPARDQGAVGGPFEDVGPGPDGPEPLRSRDPRDVGEAVLVVADVRARDDLPLRHGGGCGARHDSDEQGNGQGSGQEPADHRIPPSRGLSQSYTRDAGTVKGQGASERTLPASRP